MLTFLVLQYWHLETFWVFFLFAIWIVGTCPYSGIPISSSLWLIAFSHVFSQSLKHFPLWFWLGHGSRWSLSPLQPKPFCSWLCEKRFFQLSVLISFLWTKHGGMSGKCRTRKKGFTLLKQAYSLIFLVSTIRNSCTPNKNQLGERKAPLLL